MSDEANADPANDVGPGTSTPFGSSSGLLRAARQEPTGQTDQLAAFVQQQPMTAALVALAIGYVLGKIS